MIDPSAFIAPGAVVLGDVTLGRNSSVWYHAVVRGDMAPIAVGDETNKNLSMVHVDEGAPCNIGRRVGVIGRDRCRASAIGQQLFCDVDTGFPCRLTGPGPTCATC